MNFTANISKQSGLTSIEYAVIASLISVSLVAGFSNLGSNAANLVEDLSMSIAQVPSNSGNSGNSGTGDSGAGSSGSGNSGSGDSGTGSSGSGDSGTGSSGSGNSGTGDSGSGDSGTGSSGSGDSGTGSSGAGDSGTGSSGAGDSGTGSSGSGDSGTGSSGSGSSDSGSSDSGSSSSGGSSSGNSEVETATASVSATIASDDQLSSSKSLLLAQVKKSESSDINDTNSILKNNFDSVPPVQHKAKSETVTVKNSVAISNETWKWLFLAMLILTATWLSIRRFSKKAKISKLYR